MANSTVFETEIKIAREDIYTVVNLNLFDEEDAMVFLDAEKTNVDAFTDLVMAAITNGTYSKEWLMNQVKNVALPSELENMQGFEDGVGYVHSEIEDASVKKLRKARSAEIFKAANVTDPSEKFVEMLESAIWSLSDNVVYFPEEFIKNVTANGKFKPWILRMCIPVAVASFLMYQSGLAGLPTNVKILYLAITYILWGSFCYTGINIPYGSMASVMSTEANDRASLSTFRGVGSLIPQVIVGVIMPMFLYRR